MVSVPLPWMVIVPPVPDVSVRPEAMDRVSLFPSAAPPMLRIFDTVTSDVVTVTVLPLPLMVRLYSVCPAPTKLDVPSITTVFPDVAVYVPLVRMKLPVTVHVPVPDVITMAAPAPK